MKIKCRVSPSLALIKYWGKADPQKNTPATSSLALTVNALHTETTISFVEDTDDVQIDGISQSMERFTPFFDYARKRLGVNCAFKADSVSSFPIAAGLASSSSGFASLAYGAATLCDQQSDRRLISELAGRGSASAARAVFDGFTVLERGGVHAKQLFAKDHWPELRVLIAIVSKEKKPISSRDAMERAKKTSPLYKVWLAESESIYLESLASCQNKDLDTLGSLMRKSYLLMFSTMFSSNPPVLYWEPETVALIKECEILRKKGFSVWETIDAGPQVKLLCLERDARELLDILQERFPKAAFLLSNVGVGPVIV